MKLVPTIHVDIIKTRSLPTAVLSYKKPLHHHPYHSLRPSTQPPQQRQSTHRSPTTPFHHHHHHEHQHQLPQNTPPKNTSPHAVTAGATGLTFCISVIASPLSRIRPTSVRFPFFVSHSTALSRVRFMYSSNPRMVPSSVMRVSS